MQLRVGGRIGVAIVLSLLLVAAAERAAGQGTQQAQSAGKTPAAAESAAAADPAGAKAKTTAFRPKKALVPLASAGPVEKAGGDTSRTRFVIGVQKSAEFQIFSLANPNRVVVQIAETQLRLPEPMAQPVGLVKAFTGGLSGAGRARVEIEVIQPVVVESARFEKSKDGSGMLLALDIVPADGSKPRRVIGPASGLGAAGLPPPAAAAAQSKGATTPAVQPPLPRRALSPKALAQREYKPTIVIDPGHGGSDSGATKFGTVEKDVVLAFSLLLRDKLRANGRYNVLMTRETDVLVPLDDRREFGDRAKAALFIAVHADYAGSRARGATIYQLRDGVANQMRRSAKGEATAEILTNEEIAQIAKTDGDSNHVSAVKGILTSFALSSIETTQARTNEFSRIVIDNMSEATMMRHSPDQQAAYRVLKSAKVPSVLIELAYVSNQEDARNLKSDHWRSKVADTIVTAIDNFCSNQIARPAQ